MSLMETIAVLAVLGIVVNALFSMIHTFYVQHAYLFEATVSVDQARRGLTTMLHNIREASYGDDGNFPVGAAASSSVTFYSDIDTDGGVERVKIWRYEDTLYKVVTNAGGNPPTYVGQTSATSTIATFLRNASSTALFSYYDTNGVELSTSTPDLSQISSVAAHIEIDLNPSRAPQVFTLSGSATLRNLKDQ